MRKKVACLLSYLFIISAAMLVSESSHSASVCMPQATPPYSYGGTQSGLHVDIIKEAFAQVNESVSFIFLPNQRIEPSFLNRKCDMSAHLKINEATKNYYFTRVPMMTFNNNVISHKKLSLQYHSPKDLNTYKVAAFQNAHKFLGAEFAKMAQSNSQYREYGSFLPAQMLLLDRVDVVISEPNIFLYYLEKQITQLPDEVKSDLYNELQWAPLSKRGNAYYWGFQTKEYLEKFEKGLVALYKNNKFDGIFEKWAIKYSLFRSPLAEIDCEYGQIQSACIAEKKVKVMFGLSRPPFIQNDPPGGISWELASEVFNRMGYSIIPSFAPNNRMAMSLFQDAVDVAVEVQPREPKLYYSQPFISYQNFIFIRKSENLSFSDWLDLAGKKVCAWQGAINDLGKDFKAANSSFGTYSEFGVQKNQVLRWMLGSCDAVIIDKTIFHWWVKELKSSSAINKSNVDVDAVGFPIPGNNELWWNVGFKNEELRNEFDLHLTNIINDGTYSKIRHKFTPTNE